MCDLTLSSILQNTFKTTLQSARIRYVKSRLVRVFFLCMIQSNKIHLEWSQIQDIGAENVCLYHFI